MDGAEIAQLYVSARGKGASAENDLLQKGMVYRPAKELKGFQKVFLKAGESRRITITLDDKAFRYFNRKTNRFETEGGEYDILIGASVADIRLSGTVSVKGTDAPFPYQANKMKNYYSGNIQNISDLEFTELLGHGDDGDGRRNSDSSQRALFSRTWQGDRRIFPFRSKKEKGKADALKGSSQFLLPVKEGRDRHGICK